MGKCGSDLPLSAVGNLQAIKNFDIGVISRCLTLDIN